jgi:hypothetical protein
MPSRKLSAAAAGMAALCGALALAGVASAGGSAGHHAKTRLSIQAFPRGLFGYVDSAKSHACASRRDVVVFKQRGAEQRPHRDKRLGGGVAKRNQGGYQWSKKTGKTGEFYAKAHKTPDCRVAYSRTIHSLPRGGDTTPCPFEGEYCKFTKMHIDITTYCPGYGDTSSGDCSGDSTGGRFPWSPAFGYFVWEQNKPGTKQRSVEYHATAGGGDKTPRAELFGTNPDPGSDVYSVDNAIAQASSLPDLRWYTPDIAGVAPGQVGGPLSLDFQNGTVGADVYISGYLFRKVGRERVRAGAPDSGWPSAN